MEVLKLKYKAIESFSGKINMSKGDIKEIPNKKLAESLKKSNLIVEYVPNVPIEVEKELSNLKAENDKLKEENPALKAENDKLKEENSTLKAENDKLKEENPTLKVEDNKSNGENSTPKDKDNKK